LQHFPQGEHFTLTTMFDEQGKVIQWYIDICLRHGVTENNIPWLDDLFLDIVVFPTGEIKLLDFDELKSALAVDEISKHEYDLAVLESEKLMSKISENKFALFDLCANHRRALLQTAQVS
jgi:predicted RNA-binding protein associated with RNAse of E/G family